jgi:hypothetical protein
MKARSANGFQFCRLRPLRFDTSDSRSPRLAGVRSPRVARAHHRPKICVKLQGHFRPEVRSLIARVAGAFRSRAAAPFFGSNSAKVLLCFQARKPFDIARHVASRLNALSPVSRCKRCPGLHQFIQSGILLHKAPAGGNHRIISEQLLYFDFRSSTGRLNIDFRWPARCSREHKR